MSSEPGSIGVIASAAYPDTELVAEFGRIPPAFLPLGHSRAFERQVAALAPLVERVALTLPRSYEPPPSEAAWLADHDVEVIRVPDGLRLAESVLHALVLMDARGPVRLLWGDTLFTAPLPPDLDVAAVAPTPEFYSWASVAGTGRRARFDAAGDASPTVLAGYFAFADARGLLGATLGSGGDFLNALRSYAAVNGLRDVTIDGWMDLGHLQTYWTARSQVSIARSFNALDFTPHTVVKRSADVAKVEAEASWFERIPARMRLYTPAFLGREPGGYRLGYEASPTLHELFVFGELPVRTWEKIVDVCGEFLEACRTAGTPPTGEVGGLDDLLVAKTRTRLERFAAERDVPLDAEWTVNGQRVPSLARIAERCSELVDVADTRPGVLHGDFCFTNVFFDYQSALIKVVDPRGRDGRDRPTVWGDLRYDLAKFNHSIQGYDAILTGRYRLQRSGATEVMIDFPNSRSTDELERAAESRLFAALDVPTQQVAAITTLLFLSMLPLHGDRPDRQDAFLANALRLFSRLETT